MLSDIRKFPRSFWFVAILCVTFYSAIFPFTALSMLPPKFPMMMFASLGFVGLVFAFLLKRADRREGSALERP